MVALSFFSRSFSPFDNSGIDAAHPEVTALGVKVRRAVQAVTCTEVQL